MRQAVLNRTVSAPKYDLLVQKCGGSKNTARAVLDEMCRGFNAPVRYRGKGKGYEWSDNKRRSSK